jgi:mannose-6-phosphate isomerase-like protein (cupin superfamily)
MKRTAIDAVEQSETDAAVGRYRLSEALETDEMAINHYRIPPGDGLPAGLHAHLDQEEVFVVLEGEATFETLPPRDGDGSGTAGGSADDGLPDEAGEVTVEAGEAIRVAPGEFQSGHNDADEDLIVLALGAPPDSEDVRLPFSCPDCGAEHRPAPCLDCDGSDLEATLGEDRVVVACRDCGAAFDEPPLRD